MWAATLLPYIMQWFANGLRQPAGVDAASPLIDELTVVRCAVPKATNQVRKVLLEALLLQLPNAHCNVACILV